MTDTTIPNWRLPAQSSRDDAASARPRPRLRGPVLMGDLHASFGGRPLLLTHWDEPEDEG